MSEYWKSTPKYWCKHCQVFVRDTKLERSNHDATGKHKGALKRFLRDLHRGHDKDEREKDRAKREIERLNGVVGSSSSAAAGPSSSSATGPDATKPSSSSSSQISANRTEAQRQKQWEQLADLGIDVPTELRGDMAMVGDWQVTNSRVIDDTLKTDESSDVKFEGVATGVRKRVKREGEEEEEEAMQTLFKKPRKWGRDTKHALQDDADLDALLGGNLAPVRSDKAGAAREYGIKPEEEVPSVKKEPLDDDQGIPSIVTEELETNISSAVKLEPKTDDGDDAPAVVFKKRKPKNLRQTGV